MRDQGVHAHRLPTWVALAVVAVSIVAGCESGDASSDDVDATPPTASSTALASPDRTRDTTAASTDVSTGVSQPVAPSTESTTVDISATVSTSSGAPTSDAGRLTHPAGLELRYPPGWTASPASKIATEFSQGADCASVEVVDFEPPTGSGEAEAGFALRSVVQVCARPTEVSSVEDFLAAVYGGIQGFDQIEIDGEPAYRRGDTADSIAFALDKQFAFQILTSVVADPKLEPQRIDELETIVESIRFT